VEGRDLARVRNILERPAVALLADDYDEDWSRLAWVALRGAARIVEPGAAGHPEGVAALREKYAQYRSTAIDARPLIVVADLTARSWTGAGPAEGSAPIPRSGRAELGVILRGRRSVRAFRPDPVPRSIIEAAIAAAGWAPSPHGRQPWRFAVVEAPARKARLVTAMAEEWRAQLRLDGQDAAIVDIRLHKSRQRLMEAPLVVVPCLYLADLDDYPDAARMTAERTMAIQSLGAAIQNFMLSIYAAGLDSGWMCAPLFCPEVVRDALDLDVALIPQALLPVGYAAKDPVRRPRLPLDRLIVDWS
jgi:F420 biosynthesis protein FbiB-like protein